MESDLIKTIESAVEKSITKNVNGKIDAVHAKLDDHIKQHACDMNRLEPVIDGVKFINTGRRFLVWVAAPLGILASTWLAVKGYIK